MVNHFRVKVPTSLVIFHMTYACAHFCYKELLKIEQMHFGKPVG